MKKIHYSTIEKKWFHTYPGETLYLGKSSKPLSFSNTIITPSQSLSISYNRNKLGPIVGIMTSRKKDGSIAGNGPLFKGLQQEMQNQGGVCIVFTPEDLFEDNLNGYLYLPKNDRWMRITSPLPHLIYNRIPFRYTEGSEKFKEAILICERNNIPFFNPSFLDKHELYELFKKHDNLQPYFLDTILISDKDSLYSFLKQNQNIYLKPSKAAKGKGIFRIRLQKDESIELDSLTLQTNYQNFNEFWFDHEALFINKFYIAQKEIDPALHNGYRYDFRILSHYIENQYVITGIGVRQSFCQDITTHIPNGGKLLSYEEVKTEEYDKLFEGIIQECGNHLTQTLGFFGEFSVDAGLTKDGKLVIYEINSKPMSFDEEHIESKRLRNLCELFFHLTQMKPAPQ